MPYCWANLLSSGSFNVPSSFTRIAHEVAPCGRKILSLTSLFSDEKDRVKINLWDSSPQEDWFERLRSKPVETKEAPSGHSCPERSGPLDAAAGWGAIFSSHRLCIFIAMMFHPCLRSPSSSEFASLPLTMHHGPSLVAQLAKNPPAMQETLVWSLGWDDRPEEEMAMHSCILAWKIPWTGEPGVNPQGRRGQIQLSG